MSDALRNWIDCSGWNLVKGNTETGPLLLRFREPELPPEIAVFPNCLRVVWGYDDEGSGTLPDGRCNEHMEVFENRLCAAWEHDALAVLTAVLTFDGARQWVFYTSDVQACVERLNSMPQESEAYPIELDAFNDPTWNYLHEEIIRDRGNPNISV